MSDGTISVKARIRGRVQGVGFRAWTVSEARKLGLTGSVRNEPDGSVSAVFFGTKEAVESLIARLRVGPAGSRVTDIDTEAAAVDIIPTDFTIIR